MATTPTPAKAPRATTARSAASKAPKASAVRDEDLEAADEPEATTPSESESIDARLEAEELRAELLADMPALRPAHKFRIRHRNAFQNVSLEAIKSGAFDRDNLSYDLNDPKDIEAFQALQEFIATIDEWAESIAEDPDAYAAWSEGKDEETFMAIYVEYRRALGESRGSAS
ncbi:hypothetical protein QE418_003379 [Microbacterium testaceum]|uniref:hypothetical protein n=1 Tax=Microbacterium TaxID=33882 RepID=UPI00278B5879|nr:MULTISPECIES: hypothetical protein [Microbacterium]MDQ1113931.1 hypothetical protein [Microbacterium testaceum]MDR6098962.1 hypothetical protein [Microbacterium sp. SORGH_AS_0454]